MWNSDGNVVLQAQNTQFRVHWSVLARHSSVFRDMQGLPQPDGQPSVDRCPVMEIYDDPQGVKYLLEALYIPSVGFGFPRRVLIFSRLVANLTAINLKPSSFRLSGLLSN
jgi:hypothetical protein